MSIKTVILILFNSLINIVALSRNVREREIGRKINSCKVVYEYTKVEELERPSGQSLSLGYISRNQVINTKDEFSVHKELNKQIEIPNKEKTILARSREKYCATSLVLERAKGKKKGNKNKNKTLEIILNDFYYNLMLIQRSAANIFRKNSKKDKKISQKKYHLRPKYYQTRLGNY